MKRLRDIVEAMTTSQAHAIFKKHGVDSVGKSKGELQSSYKSLMLRHHPDRGGNVEHAKEINAAYDHLKSGKPSPSSPSGSWGAGSRGHTATPEWAWAGHSGGMPPSGNYRPSMDDVNYIKKRMWELSGKSREEHTVHQFDGNFFRKLFTTYGSDDIHHHMAHAMLHWGSNHSSGHNFPTKAIFVSKKKEPRKLHMIWANGRHTTGHSIEHESFNHNPDNDQHFVNRLSDWIDKKVPPK